MMRKLVGSVDKQRPQLVARQRIALEQSKALYPNPYTLLLNSLLAATLPFYHHIVLSNYPSLLLSSFLPLSSS